MNYFSPQLTWRDIQHLTVLTSKRNSLFDAKGRFHWTMNGVGLEFNHLFGYGVLDAGAMVALAKKWKTVPPRYHCEAGSVFETQWVVLKIRKIYHLKNFLTCLSFSDSFLRNTKAYKARPADHYSWMTRVSISVDLLSRFSSRCTPILPFPDIEKSPAVRSDKRFLPPRNFSEGRRCVQECVSISFLGKWRATDRSCWK